MDDLLFTNKFENDPNNVNIDTDQFGRFIESKDNYQNSYSNTKIGPLEGSGNLNNVGNQHYSHRNIKKTVVTIDSKNRLRTTKIKKELLNFGNKKLFLPSDPFQTQDKSILVKIHAPNHNLQKNMEILFTGLDDKFSNIGIYKSYLEFNEIDIKPIFTIKDIYNEDYFFIEISNKSIINGSNLYDININNIITTNFGGDRVQVYRVVDRMVGYSSSNHYKIDLPRKFSNVVKVKLVSIELPNTSYTINSTRKTSNFGSFNNLTTKINSNLNWINENDYQETYNMQVYTDRCFTDTLSGDHPDLISSTEKTTDYQTKYAQKVFDKIVNNDTIKSEYSKISSKNPDGNAGYGDYRTKDFFSPRYLLTDVGSEKNISHEHGISLKYWLSSMYHNIQPSLISELQNYLGNVELSTFKNNLLQLKKNSLFLYNYYLALIQKPDGGYKSIGINESGDMVEIPKYQGITIIKSDKNEFINKGLIIDEYVEKSPIGSIYVYPTTYNGSEKYVEPMLLPDIYMESLNAESSSKIALEKYKRYPIYNTILKDGKYNQILFTNMIQVSLQNINSKIYDNKSGTFTENSLSLKKHFANETPIKTTFKVNMDANSSYIDIRQYMVIDQYKNDPNYNYNLLYYNKDIPYIFIESLGSVIKSGDIVRLDGFSKTDNISADKINKEHVCTIFNTYTAHVRLIYPLPDNVYMDQAKYFNNTIGNNITATEEGALQSIKRDLRRFLIPEDRSNTNYYDYPGNAYKNLGNNNNIFGNNNNANKETYPISTIDGKFLSNTIANKFKSGKRLYNQFDSEHDYKFGIYKSDNNNYTDSFRSLHPRSSESFVEGTLVSKLDNNNNQINIPGETFKTNINYYGSKLVNSVNNGSLIGERYNSFNSNSFDTKTPKLSLLKYELIVKLSDIESEDTNIIIGRIMKINSGLNNSGNYSFNYDIISDNSSGNFKPGDAIIGLESNCVVYIVPETWNYDGLPNQEVIINGLGSYLLEKYRNIEPIKTLISQYKLGSNKDGSNTIRLNNILKFKNKYNNWYPKKNNNSNYGFYININHFPNNTTLKGIKTKFARILKPIKYKFLLDIPNSPSEILNFPEKQEFNYVQSNYIETNCLNIIASSYSEIYNNTVSNYIILEVNDRHSLQKNDTVYISNHQIKSNDNYQKILRIKSCEPFRNYLTYLNENYLHGNSFNNINTIFDYKNNTILYNIGLDSITNAFSYSYDTNSTVSFFGHFSSFADGMGDSMEKYLHFMIPILFGGEFGRSVRYCCAPTDVVNLIVLGELTSFKQIANINYDYYYHITVKLNEKLSETGFLNMEQLTLYIGNYEDDGIPLEVEYFNINNKYNIYTKFNSSNIKSQGFRDKCVEWFFKNPNIWNGNDIEKVLQFKYNYFEKHSVTNSIVELDLVTYRTSSQTKLKADELVGKIIYQGDNSNNYGIVVWNEECTEDTLQTNSLMNRIGIQMQGDSISDFIKGQTLTINDSDTNGNIILPAPIRIFNKSKKSVIGKLIVSPIDSNGNNFTSGNNHTIEVILDSAFINNPLIKYSSTVLKIGTLIFQAGHGAFVNAIMSTTSGIERIEIIDGGVGYSTDTLINITNNSADETGTGAKARVSTIGENGAIQTIEVTDIGSNYSHTPIIKLVPVKKYAKIKENIDLLNHKNNLISIKVTMLKKDDIFSQDQTIKQPLSLVFYDIYNFVSKEQWVDATGEPYGDLKLCYDDGGKPYNNFIIKFGESITKINPDYSQQCTPIHFLDSGIQNKTFIREGPYTLDDDGDQTLVARNSTSIYPFLKGMGVYYYDQEDSSIYNIKPKLIGYVMDTSLNNIKEYIDDYQISDYRTISNNYIASIKIIHGGRGYTKDTIVSIINNPADLTGIGAKARVTKINENGSIENIEIINGGRNYTLPPVIELQSNKNDSVNAIVYIDLINQNIDSINIINGGIGYNLETTINIIPNPLDQPVSGAKAIVKSVSANGSITEINLIEQWGSFTKSPYIQIGTNASGYTTIENGSVNTLILLDGGLGYTQKAIIKIINHPSDTTGWGAIAWISYIENGTIQAIEIIVGGEGYTSPPLIQIFEQTAAYAETFIEKFIPTYTLYVDINEDSDLYWDWSEHFFPTSYYWETERNPYFPGSFKYILLYDSEKFSKYEKYFTTQNINNFKEHLTIDVNELIIEPNTDGKGTGCKLKIEFQTIVNEVGTKKISKIYVLTPGRGYNPSNKLFIDKNLIGSSADLFIPIKIENLYNSFNHMFPIEISINYISLKKIKRTGGEFGNKVIEFYENKNNIDNNSTDAERQYAQDEMINDFYNIDHDNSPSFLYPYDQFYMLGTKKNNYSRSDGISAKIYTVKSNIGGVITVFGSNEVIYGEIKGMDLIPETITETDYPEFCIIKGRSNFDHEGFYNLDKIINGTNIYFNNANYYNDSRNINNEIDTDSQLNTAQFENNLNSSINMRKSTIYNDSKSYNNTYLKNRQAIATIVQGTIYNEDDNKNYLISGAYDHFYKNHLQNKCIINYKQPLTKVEKSFINNHQIIEKHPEFISHNDTKINDYNNTNIPEILEKDMTYHAKLNNRNDIINPDIISLHPFEINDSVLIFEQEKQNFKYNVSTKDSILNYENTQLEETSYSNEFNKVYEKETVGINSSYYKVLCNLWNGDINSNFIDSIYRPGQSVLIDEDFNGQIEKGFMNKGFMKVSGIVTDIVNNNSNEYLKDIEEDKEAYNCYKIISPNSNNYQLKINDGINIYSKKLTNLEINDVKEREKFTVKQTHPYIELTDINSANNNSDGWIQLNINEYIYINDLEPTTNNIEPNRNDDFIYINSVASECILSPLDIIIINPNIYGTDKVMPKQNANNKFSELTIVADVQNYTITPNKCCTRIGLISRLINNHKVNDYVISKFKYGELYENIYNSSSNLNASSPYKIKMKKSIKYYKRNLVTTKPMNSVRDNYNDSNNFTETIINSPSENYINVGDTICFNWAKETYIDFDSNTSIPYSISDSTSGKKLSTLQFNTILSITDKVDDIVQDYYIVTLSHKPIINYLENTPIMVFKGINNNQLISTQPFIVNNKWFTKIYYRGKNTLNILGDIDSECKCFNTMTSKNVFIENMKGVSIPFMPLPSPNNSYNNDIFNSIYTEHNDYIPYNIEQISPIQDGMYTINPSIIEDYYNHIDKNINNLKFNGNFIESAYYIENYDKTKSIDNLTQNFEPNSNKFFWKVNDNPEIYNDYNFIIVEGFYMGYGGEIKEKYPYENNLLNNQNGYKILDTFSDNNRHFITINLKSESLGFTNNIENEYKTKLGSDAFNKNTILNNINTSLFMSNNIIGYGGKLCTKQINIPFNLNITDYIYMCIPTLNHITTNSDTTIFSSNIFSKILLPNTNASTIYNSHISGNLTFNKYEIKDIESLEIAYLTPNGYLFDFNGLDHSFTIEIYESVQSL